MYCIAEKVMMGGEGRGRRREVTYDKFMVVTGISVCTCYTVDSCVTVTHVHVQLNSASLVSSN